MTAHSEDRKFVSALSRGLSVLACFRASDNGLSHGEIAERTGLTKPTVTRLTYTLRELGYLSQSGKSGRFNLGPSAVALGSVAQTQASFIEMASDDMQELADATGTLALIAVRHGDRMMLVRTWRPKGTVSIWLEPRHRIPIFGSSSGLVWLACQSDDEFARLQPDDALTAFRQSGYEQLLAQGFAFAPSPTRYAATINAVAVPYAAGDFGETVAFSCGAMPDTLPEERMTSVVGPALRDLVRNLETRTAQRSALSRRE